MRIVRAAPVPESLRDQVFYHGCAKGELAVQIIESRTLKAPDLTGRKGFLRPMEGKVYLTNDLRLGLIYAWGGAFSGVNMDPRFWRGEPYAHLFTVAATSIHDVEPDEDVLGEALGAVARNLVYLDLKRRNIDGNGTIGYYAPRPEDALESGILADKRLYHQLSMYVQTRLTENTKQKLIGGEYIWFARAGKTAMKRLDDATKIRIVELSGTVAHTGDVPIATAWRIHKSKTEGIRPDASNFFELAEQVLPVGDKCG